MDTYRTLAVVTLPAGMRLRLTPQQAQARQHALQQDGDAWRVLRPVQFKVGEVIGCDDELPKALAELMPPIDSAGAPVPRRAAKSAKSTGKTDAAPAPDPVPAP